MLVCSVFRLKGVEEWTEAPGAVRARRILLSGAPSRAANGLRVWVSGRRGCQELKRGATAVVTLRAASDCESTSCVVAKGSTGAGARCRWPTARSFIGGGGVKE